jgi:hypothetical protein
VWPYSFLIEIADQVLVVACDDEVTAARLRAVEIDPSAVDPDLSPRLVDYGVRTDRGVAASAARALCMVQHGSSVLGRSLQSERSLDGFWRILGTRATPPAAGRVRLDVGVIRHLDGLVVVPRPLASSLAPGWLRDRGVEQLLVHHVDVGVDDAGVPIARVAAPLTGEGRDVCAPVLSWVVDIGVGSEAAPAPAAPHLSELVAYLASSLVAEDLRPDTVGRLASVVTAAQAQDRVLLCDQGRAAGQGALGSIVGAPTDTDSSRRR